MSLEAWGDENPADADYDTWSDRALDAGWFDPDDYSPGALAILRERERQEVEEGWTPDHDDEHEGGELSLAACAYAFAAQMPEIMRDVVRPENGGVEHSETLRELWPWADEWWKPKDRRADLVRAGALIAAEIDRLDRAEDRRPEPAP